MLKYEFIKKSKLFSELIRSAYPSLKSSLTLGGIQYIKKRNLFFKSQWWSRKKLEDYQLRKLNILFNHIYNNVRYYRRLFKNLNLKPKNIKSFEDLEKIPILTREDVIKNFNDLIAKNVSINKLELHRTSGSTGKPLKFYLDKNSKINRNALYTRRLDMMKHKCYNKRISIEFTFFLNRREFMNNNYFCDKFSRNLYLSSKAHTFKDFDMYLRIIKKFKPAFIQGNPSMLYLLASHAEEKNIRDIYFGSFLSLFENLYNFQKEKISEIFKCKIFNYYGSSENIISAMECEKHNGLHIDMERGILEIVDKNNFQIHNNKRGKIIATGLTNFAMPLIRYEIGDFGTLSKKECTCGRGSPLLKSIDGRNIGILKYKDRFIYPTTLSLLIWKIDNIKECQFIQKNDHELTLNIVKRKNYSNRDTKILISLIKKVINDPTIGINIQFTKFIPRTKGGKFEFVIKKQCPKN